MGEPNPNMRHGIVHDQGGRRRETVILSLSVHEGSSLGSITDISWTSTDSWTLFAQGLGSRSWILVALIDKGRNFQLSVENTLNVRDIPLFLTGLTITCISSLLALLSNPIWELSVLRFLFVIYGFELLVRVWSVSTVLVKV